MMHNPLPRSFYKQDLHNLALSLLGCVFVRVFENANRLSAKIVEVEAYSQQDDPSSHAYNGKTPRNEVMFGAPGHLYVYFTYGMHFCSNVVAGKAGTGNAILIRALEPIEGIENMYLKRYGTIKFDQKKTSNLTNGPAKSCQAYKIGRSENGIDLCGNKIWIEAGTELKKNRIACSTRIGINRGKELPWRYFIKENDWVSKPSKGIKYFDERTSK